MKIVKTHIGMMVENSPSILLKLHELKDKTYVKESGSGYLEIISNDKAEEYIYNMKKYNSIVTKTKKTDDE